MIFLQKNSTNVTIMELTLKSSLVNPFYMFHLTNDMDLSNTVLFTVTDQSSFKSRYNRFDIVLSGSAYVNLSAGTVDLKSGSWTYRIYESSASTLSISGCNLIETGKVIVDGEDDETPSIYR